MLTHALVDRFLEGVKGQALREGTRYAHEARVGDLIGSGEGVSTVVRGRTDDFETALWVEDGALEHRCSCPSWRNPCKHQVAAALVLKQCLARTPGFLGSLRPVLDGTRRHMVPDPRQARRQAIEERRLAARREKLNVSVDSAPFLRVTSPSGFAYRVHLRRDADGPHSCDCPDFEANRLHVCKHVERVRAHLRGKEGILPPGFRRAVSRARVYLHFGEVIEPRLLGRPQGPGGPCRLRRGRRPAVPLGAGRGRAEAPARRVRAVGRGRGAGMAGAPRESAARDPGREDRAPTSAAASRALRLPVGGGGIPVANRPGASRRRDGPREDRSGDPGRGGAPPRGASGGARDGCLPREPARRLAGRDPQVARRGRDAP